MKNEVYTQHVFTALVFRPAEGVQTLSEYSALSWLDGGDADGTFNFCAVRDEVLFFCCQELCVVLLALLLLSLYSTETCVTMQEKEFRYIIEFISDRMV